MYDTKNFTWGFELEIGDVNKACSIPEQLGSWEFAETDIVNQLPPYWGRAVDPLGIDPPVGGEINIKPTKTIPEMISRLEELLNYIKNHHNQTPTVSCVSVSHVHVFVPGLKEDVESLKKLISYIKRNQHMVVDKCSNFRLHPNMSLTKTAKTYLKYDGGRIMPNYMCDNIVNLATDFDSFIKLHAAGKDGKSMGRPFRYAINTYCMKHTGTIEFRPFRNSINLNEIRDCFLFVEKFMDNALNDGSDVDVIFQENTYNFPPMTYDHELYVAWEKSKYDKSRGNKVRKFYEV
jgi:hypothetical protein